MLRKLTFIGLIANLLLAMSCSKAEFAGGGGVAKKKPEKVVNNGVTPPLPTQARADDRVSEPSDVVENADGTRKEVFLGRAIVDTEADVDIIFAVDTSGSMAQEKANVEQNLGAFLSKLQTNKALNYQVFMIGANFVFPSGTDSKRVAAVTQEVGSWDALVQFKKFFTTPSVAVLPLRKTAVKELVVITDDDSLTNKGGISADNFMKYLTDQKSVIGTVHFNGFVWLESSLQTPTCTKANVGNQYMILASNPQFGGELFDICTKDWKLLFTKLAERIISSSAQIEFALGLVADTTVDFTVLINDVPLEATFWTYSQAKNSIIFDPTHTPGEGDVLSVVYKAVKQ
jgi:hypothetical protein